MAKIFKYPLTLVSETLYEVELPNAYRVLSFGLQRIGHQLQPVVWASVWPAPEKIKVQFLVIPTGGEAPLDEGHKFEATVHSEEFGIVAHFFSKHG